MKNNLGVEQAHLLELNRQAKEENLQVMFTLDIANSAIILSFPLMYGDVKFYATILSAEDLKDCVDDIDNAINKAFDLAKYKLETIDPNHGSIETFLAVVASPVKRTFKQRLQGIAELNFQTFKVEATEVEQ